MSALDDFEKELWEEAQQYVDALKRGMNQIVSELFERILARTPFRTGYLLAQWQVGERGAEGLRRRTKFRSRYKRSSATRFGAASVALKSLQAYLASQASPFEKIEIVNNADYASFVRSGGELFEDMVELEVRSADAKEYEVEL